MSNISDTAEVVLICDGKQVKKQMQDLQKEIAKAEQKLSQLNAAGGDKKQIQQTERRLRNLRRQLSDITNAATGVSDAFANIDRATPKQLQKALQTLKKQMERLDPTSKVWKEHAEKVKALQERLRQLRSETAQQRSMWDRFKEWVNGSAVAIGAIIMAYQQVIQMARDLVNAFAQMDEQLANTRKYTGMTAEAVNELNDSFKRLDTRTARDKLNELAQEGGRLGYNTKQKVQEYVEAADIINVALVDLGKGATQEIAKISNIFGVEQQLGVKQSMLSIGSAVNVLSQNCTASKPYLVEFTKRMAGIGSQAGLTVPQILAMGAVLDANGQKVEMSSTAISKVFMKLANESKTMAKTLGMDAEKLNSTLKKSAKDGFLMFLDRLHEIGESTDYNNATMVLAPAFKEMGLDAARVSQVLSTLAKHIDEVKWQIGNANQAFREASSATNEYNIFNSTAQAEIDKAKKSVEELKISLGQKLAPTMKYLHSINSTAIKGVNVLVDVFIEYGSVLKYLTLAIVTYVAAVNHAAIATALHTAATWASNVAAAAWRATLLLCTGAAELLAGNIGRAKAAMQLLFGVIKLNPIGLLVTAITTAVVALGSWIKKTYDARKAEREANEARIKEQQEFRKSLRDTSAQEEEYTKKHLTKVKKLLAVAENRMVSFDKRIKAIKDLQALYPTYFGELNNEIFLNGKAADAYNKLAEAIKKSAKAKAIASKMEENAAKEVDLELEYDKLEDQKIALQFKMDEQTKLVDRLRKGAKTQDQWKRVRAEKAVLDDLNSQLLDVTHKMLDVGDKQHEVEQANRDLNKLAEKYAGQDEFGGNGNGKDNKSGLINIEPEGELSEQKKVIQALINRAKGEYEKNYAKVLGDYSRGLIDYEEFLKRKDKLDRDYSDAKIKIYKKAIKMGKDMESEYIDDFGSELRKNREMYNSQHDEWVKKRLAKLKKDKAAEERIIRDKHMSGDDGYGVYQDKDALQRELDRLELKYLELEQEVYAPKKKSKKKGKKGGKKESPKKPSKEFLEAKAKTDKWVEEHDASAVQKQIDSAQEFINLYEAWDSVKKNELILTLIRELYMSGRITEQQFALWSAKVRERMEADKKAAEKAALDDRATIMGIDGQKIDLRSGKEKSDQRNDDRKAELESAKKELLERYQDGLISKEEYDRGIRELNKQFAKSIFNDLAEVLDENALALGNAAMAWYDFFNSVEEEGNDKFKNLGLAIKATMGMVGSMAATASQFTEAETSRQIALLEKRYDREIELAQGNTYKVAKLERKKEEEIRQIKRDAANKEFQMKVISAIADTAANAVMAYGVGLGAGFPVATWLAPLLAGLAVAQGTVQVALLKKQQQAAAAGYAKGGFTRKGRVNEEAGVVHAGEWVASQKLVNSPVARPLIDALEYAQRTNRVGSLALADASTHVAPTPVVVNVPAQDNSAMEAAIAHNAAVIESLNARLNEPIIAVAAIAGDNGVKHKLDEYNNLINNITPKSKRG